MAELPFHLKTLPPEALDIIRFFGASASPLAHAHEIADGLGLSDRAFGKSIRRLVTKGYVTMDGDQMYRLTDQGQTAVDELSTFDVESPQHPTSQEQTVQKLQRHFVVVVPSNFIVDEPTEVFAGFAPAEEENLLNAPADIVVRVSVLNGEPENPQEEIFKLSNDAIHRTFEVTAAAYSQLRVRAEVIQLGPNPTDVDLCGGLYVDVDVVASFDSAGLSLQAYGVDIDISPI